MFINFLRRFVIDQITCYYFRLMTYSIGRKYHCEAKIKIANRNPWYDKMVIQTDNTFKFHVCKFSI